VTRPATTPTRRCASGRARDRVEDPLPVVGRELEAHRREVGPARMQERHQRGAELVVHGGAGCVTTDAAFRGVRPGRERAQRYERDREQDPEEPREPRRLARGPHVREVPCDVGPVRVPERAQLEHAPGELPEHDQDQRGAIGQGPMPQQRHCGDHGAEPQLGHRTGTQHDDPLPRRRRGPIEHPQGPRRAGIAPPAGQPPHPAPPGGQHMGNAVDELSQHDQEGECGGRHVIDIGAAPGRLTIIT
jgi:hypothetical protein